MISGMNRKTVMIISVSVEIFDIQSSNRESKTNPSQSKSPFVNSGIGTGSIGTSEKFLRFWVTFVGEAGMTTDFVVVARLSSERAKLSVTADGPGSASHSEMAEWNEDTDVVLRANPIALSVGS